MGPLPMIAVERGVFLTAEAHAAGMDRRAIAREVYSGRWHRVRRGAFVPGDVWAVADSLERHRILAAAVHRSYGDRVAFSHTTAAVLHGIDVWDVDLSRVHVTRLDGGAGRTEPDVVHHEAWCLDRGDVVRVQDALATAPARAAVETGALHRTETALVTLDSVLHHGLATALDLGNAHDVVQRWPGTRHLQIALRMADPRAESVGESRSRWLFYTQQLPAPELQFEVRDEHGRLIGTTDFAWPRHRCLGEFDGKVKYGRLRRPDETAESVVVREKRREDDLRRATDYGMVRLMWPDLDRPLATGRWLRDYLIRSA